MHKNSNLEKAGAHMGSLCLGFSSSKGRRVSLWRNPA